MSSLDRTQDRVFAGLNPLVIDGQLSPQQAQQVYDAVAPLLGSAGTGAAGSHERPRWSADRARAGLVCAGAGLIAAAVLVATFAWALQGQNGEGGGFDVKIFVALLGSGLLAGALGALLHWRMPESVARLMVVGALGVTAIYGVTSAITHAWGETGGLSYVVGVVLIAAGIGAYALTGADVLLLAAVAGGLIIGSDLLSDFLGDRETPSTGPIVTAAMLGMLFGLVVIAAGWRFAARHMTGVAGLTVALASLWLGIVVIGALGALIATFGTPSGGLDGLGGPSGGDVVTDIRILLVMSLLVSLVGVVLYAFSGLPRYLVVSMIGLYVIPATAVLLTGTTHPLRWAAVWALGGLVLAGWQLLRVGRSGSRGGQPLPGQ